MKFGCHKVITQHWIVSHHMTYHKYCVIIQRILKQCWFFYPLDWTCSNVTLYDWIKLNIEICAPGVFFFLNGPDLIDKNNNMVVFIRFSWLKPTLVEFFSSDRMENWNNLNGYAMINNNNSVCHLTFSLIAYILFVWVTFCLQCNIFVAVRGKEVPW